MQKTLLSAGGSLDRAKWLDRIARRLAACEQGAVVDVARDLLRRCRQITREVVALEPAIAALVVDTHPDLMRIPGCGPLTAAKIVAEIGAVDRFANDAKLAMHAGVAPIPCSTGRTDRFRLNRSGNRQLNLAVHRIALIQGRIHEPARAYLARRQADGLSRREAMRCLKRHIVRRVYNVMKTPQVSEVLTWEQPRTRPQTRSARPRLLSAQIARPTMFPYELRPDVWLELLEPRHAKELFRVTDSNRDHLREWLPWVDETTTVANSNAFIQATRKQLFDNNGFHTKIRSRDALVGMIGHHGINWANRSTSLGYWLAKDAQGNGIMTDSCRAYINHAFGALGLNRVEIRCASENRRSRAIPERLGFMSEGTIREAEWLYDHFVDHVVYGVLASDWNG